MPGIGYGPLLLAAMLGESKLTYGAFLCKQSILWSLFWMVIVFTAYLFNPSEASFQSYLTDLSFHLHLRRLRARVAAPADDAKPSEQGHVLSFSNRISISLRTPPYTLKNYGLFTIVRIVTPAAAKPTPRNSKKQSTNKLWADRGGLFIGLLGKWWAIDDGSSENGLREKKRSGQSVLGYDSGGEEDSFKPSDIKRESPDLEKCLPDSTPQPSLSDAQPRKPSRLAQLQSQSGPIFRAGQRRPSPRGSKPDRISPLPSPELPADTDKSNSLLKTDIDQNLPGLPFHVDDKPALAIVADRIVAKQVEAEDLLHKSPYDPATETGSVQALRAQLVDVQSTADTAQSKLQAELDELKARKRDEDDIRVELKVKAKRLEDAKRAAESDRAEADRKLSSAKATKKAMEDRIGRLRGEISKMEKRERDLKDKLVKGRKDRKDQEEKLKREIAKKEEDLLREEETATKLAARVSSLEYEIADRQVELVNIKDMTYSYMSPYPHAARPNSAVSDSLSGLSRTASGSYLTSPNLQHSSLFDNRHHRRHTDDPSDKNLSNFSPFGPADMASLYSDLPKSASPTEQPDGMASPYRNDQLSPQPFSPLTPNQTSLIPSQLFNMLDDVEMPPTPSKPEKRIPSGESNKSLQLEEEEEELPKEKSVQTPGLLDLPSWTSPHPSQTSPEFHGIGSDGGSSDAFAAFASTSPGAIGSGRLSPNSAILERARNYLSLNPDAKSFAFNHPLPDSQATIGNKRSFETFDSLFGSPTSSSSNVWPSSASSSPALAARPTTAGSRGFSPFDRDDLLAPSSKVTGKQ